MYKKTGPHNEDSRPLFFFLLPEKEKQKRKTKSISLPSFVSASENRESNLPREERLSLS